MRVVLGYLETWRFDVGDPLRPTSFDESDLRLANRAGARISAAEIATILERRRAIERALRGIASNASLAARQNTVPWPTLHTALRRVRGHPRGRFLEDDEGAPPKAPCADPHARQRRPGIPAGRRPRRPSFVGERALALVRGYKRDLDHNSAAVRAVRQEITTRGHELTEVRILDLLIWSVQAAA